MGKVVMMALAAFFVIGLVSAGATYAGESVREHGTIRSVDMSKGEVVFCPKGTEEHLVVKMDEEMIKDVEAGDQVTLTYDKGETNVATKLKKKRKVKIPVGC